MGEGEATGSVSSVTAGNGKNMLGIAGTNGSKVNIL